MDDGNVIKERQREMWTSGDYVDIATTIESVAAGLVDRMDLADGQDALDVACGTGNATIPAAQRGARLTGLDLTPKLIEIARRRAEEAGVEATFLEGDAERLPFDDGSFDRVMSVLGAMFAPDQKRTAEELIRVCRPGGRIGFCAWTPAGLNGRMFALLASHLPPPPEGFMPPILWGVEDHVRGLLSAADGEPEFELGSVTFEADSIEDWLDYHERALGPMVVAKGALEPQGVWEEVRGELHSLYAGENEARDGGMRVQAEYLTTTLTLPG